MATINGDYDRRGPMVGLGFTSNETEVRFINEYSKSVPLALRHPATHKSSLRNSSTATSALFERNATHRPLDSVS